MSLLPYFFDDLRPGRIHDQLFGMDLTPDDFLTDIIDWPVVPVRRKYLRRPWRNPAAVARDVRSTIKSDKNKFQVNLDVQHFDPEEISVKVSDGYIVIEGKHEERQDEYGYVSRHFKRRYALPEGCNPDTVESRLSSDGVLTVVAPKVSENKNEKAVPITRTGPVRKKPHSEEEVEEAEKNEMVNGEADKQEGKSKTPQKRCKKKYFT